MINRHLLLCLVLSGMSGLAFELLWVRQLALAMGSTTLSFSTVLAVFFGGLAAGSILAGRRAARVERPTRAYALIELGIGLLGLLLSPLLRALPELFARFDPGEGGAGLAARFVVSLVLLAVPTLMMGATLPLALRAMVVRDTDVGPGTAIVYGINTFGAFLGAYVVSFHALPHLGVAGSTWATAGTNGLAAAIALLPATAIPAPEPEHPQDRGPGVDQLLARTTAFAAFAGGFAAIALQVLWVRLFGAFMGGSSYATGSVLMAVLVGIGLGSLAVARFTRSARSSLGAFALAQVVLVGSVVALFARLPRIQYDFETLNGPELSIGALTHRQLAAVLVVLIVPTLCQGASLPALVRVIEASASRAGAALSRLYAANTAGSILGSVVTGYVLLPLIGAEATAQVALLVIVAGAALPLVIARRALGDPRFLAAVPPLLLVLAVYDGFDAERLSIRGDVSANFRRFESSVATEKKRTQLFVEGQSAGVRVTGTPGSRGLTLNGLGQGAWSDQPPHHTLESLLVAVVPWIHTSTAQRALVVGLGAGVTPHALKSLGVAQVEVVELEAAVIPAHEKIMGAERLTARPGVEIRVGDARHELLVHKQRGGAGFDIITSMPAHPWVAAPLFTREFFALARDNLNPGGVFSTWFGVGGLDRTVGDSMVRAFVAEFPYAVALYIPEVSALFLVGSSQPIPVRPERVDRVPAELVRWKSPLFFASRTVAATGPDTDPLSPGPINTDDAPYVEFFGARTSTQASRPSAVFGPRRVGRAAVGAAADQGALVESIVQSQLGLPGGELPLGSVQRFFVNAEGWLDSLGELLSPERRALYRAVIAAQRDPVGGREPLLAVARGPDPSARAIAQKYLWSLESDPRKRRRLLPQLAPLSWDVYALAPEDARALDLPLPAEAPSAALTAAAWVLSKDDGHALSPEETQQFASSVAPELSGTLSAQLMRAAGRVASKAELTQVRDVFDDAAADLERRQRAGLAEQARQLRARGRLPEALELLVAVDERHALEGQPLFDALALSVQLGRTDLTERWATLLRARGVAVATIEHIRRSATTPP